MQWPKLLDQDAQDAHLNYLHGKLVKHADEQRLNIRFRMAALQDAFAAPPKHLSPEDTVAFQKRASEQIEAARAEHDAIPHTFDVEPHREGSTLGLGACKDHMHEDLEWYGRLHLPTCDDTPTCGCPERPKTEEGP